MPKQLEEMLWVQTLGGDVSKLQNVFVYFWRSRVILVAGQGACWPPSTDRL